jgi:hypothetical protein
MDIIARTDAYREEKRSLGKKYHGWCVRYDLKLGRPDAQICSPNCWLLFPGLVAIGGMDLDEPWDQITARIEASGIPFSEGNFPRWMLI